MYNFNNGDEIPRSNFNIVVGMVYIYVYGIIK